MGKRCSLESFLNAGLHDSRSSRCAQTGHANVRHRLSKPGIGKEKLCLLSQAKLFSTETNRYFVFYLVAGRLGAVDAFGVGLG